MNVFVPFTEFDRCAAFLDDARLNKQLAEGAQIMRQIDIWPHGAWSHHPAIMSWVGHLDALFAYLHAVELERHIRGFRTHREWLNILDKFVEFEVGMPFDYPTWWGEPAVHKSHYDNLLLKFAGHPHGDYVWPVSISK
jgi:hypothetical protein